MSIPSHAERVFVGLLAYRFLDLLWLAGLIAVVVLVIQKPERVKHAYDWAKKHIEALGG